MFIEFLRTMQVRGPYVIVAPLSLIPKWIQDFQKWLPSLPIARLDVAAEERDEMYSEQLNPVNRKQLDFPAIIVSYEVAIVDREFLNRIGKFTHVIIDEGGFEEYRNTLISSMKGIASENHLFLGKAPLKRDLRELATMLNFVKESFFSDNLLTWIENIKRAINEEKEQEIVSKLHDALMPFVNQE